MILPVKPIRRMRETSRDMNTFLLGWPKRDRQVIAGERQGDFDGLANGERATTPCHHCEGNPNQRGGSGAPAGTRTQDPQIKSLLLYQLSYRRRCDPSAVGAVAPGRVRGTVGGCGVRRGDGQGVWGFGKAMGVWGDSRGGGIGVGEGVEGGGDRVEGCMVKLALDPPGGGGGKRLFPGIRERSPGGLSASSTMGAVGPGGASGRAPEFSGAQGGHRRASQRLVAFVERRWMCAPPRDRGCAGGQDRSGAWA